MASNTYDAKKYPLCAPFYGPRGPAWITVFAPAFKRGLMGETDNYSSLYNHLVDQNDPGNIKGPQHAGGNPGILSAQALNNR